MIPAILANLGRIAGGAAEGAGMAGAPTKLVEGLTKVSEISRQAGGALGQVTGGFKGLIDNALRGLPNQLLEAQQMIVSVGASWVNALAAPIDTVKQLGDVIGRFTSLSNPGGMKMLQFRIENSMATIGQVLNPVLNSLVMAAEHAGDAIAKMKPALEPMAKSVGDLINTVSSNFAPVMREMTPLIDTATAQLRLFNTELKLMSMALKPFLSVFKFVPTGVLAALSDIFGGGRKFDENAKSDLAIKEPRYIGAEDLFREQAKNALMASMGPQDQKKDVPTLIEQIKTKLENLPQRIADAIARAILQVKIVQAIRNEAREQISGTPLETPARYGVFGLGGIAVSR